METRILLKIEGVQYELNPDSLKDSLKNWDDILCTYKRTDYSGVMRSFTSKFDFVGEAYDLLLAAYLAKGISTQASVEVYVIDNSWEYHKKFECPLDFATAQIENYTFSISAVDNSLAAMIKANKGTKYEFDVDTEAGTDGTFSFDRIPMQESVTYAFANGETDEETGALLVTHPAGQQNIWIGGIGNEIVINGVISWNEDQEEEDDSFLIEAYKAVDVKFDADIVLDGIGQGGRSIDINVERINPYGNVVETFFLGSFGGPSPHAERCIGEFSSESQLPELTGYSQDHDGQYALVHSVVYQCIWMGVWVWRNTKKTEYEFLLDHRTRSHTFRMAFGDKLRFRVPANSGSAVFRVVSSKFNFSWQARGESVSIPSQTPATILDLILRKMTEGKVNARGIISGHDERLSRTYLMAAETIRGIHGARFYSSFNEFVTWMEVVFGYTYYLSEPRKSKLTIQAIREAAGIVTTPYESDAHLDEVPPSDWIYYNSAVGKFMVVHNGHYYTWNGSPAYNNPGTERPYTDRLYRIEGKYYYFETDGEGNINPEPVEYKGDPDNVGNDFQDVVFVHRSELFAEDAPRKSIAHAIEARYSVNQSSVYSAVEIGYDQKDYNNVNGRDEFNFGITYSTGCALSDKKLSLISKYRADSYGIEFAAQQRGADTTDSKSDNDVFFVLCESAGSNLRADRSLTIEGALSDAVFNGAFSPIHCVRANAGYIGMQSDVLTLSFASSTGNSDIVIDGAGISSDLTLDTPLMTCGELEFITGDLDTPAIDSIVEVTAKGIRYEGYIKEVEETYAKEAAAKYKILVKRMES